MHIPATTEISLLTHAPQSTERALISRLAGLAFASLVPAVFWCAIIGLFAKWLGFGLSTTALAVIGGVIAVFLFAVCAPFMLRTPSATLNAEEREALTD